MNKVRKCSHKDCDKDRMRRPNSTIYFKYCRDHEIAHVLSKHRSEKAKDKAGLERMRKNGKKTAQERFYQSTAWRWCSKYVLLKYADEDLNVRCSTSPHLVYRVTDKEIHAGHYHKADQHKATALEFKNIAPQNARDNTKLSGKPEVMAQWIEDTHGKGTLEWLNKKKNESYKLDAFELGSWATHYRTLFNQELKRRGIKNPWKR